MSARQPASVRDDLIPPMRAAAILGISTDTLLIWRDHPDHRDLKSGGVRLPSGHYRYSESAVRSHAKRIGRAA